MILSQGSQSAIHKFRQCLQSPKNDTEAALTISHIWCSGSSHNQLQMILGSTQNQPHVILRQCSLSVMPDRQHAWSTTHDAQEDSQSATHDAKVVLRISHIILTGSTHNLLHMILREVHNQTDKILRKAHNLPHMISGSVQSPCITCRQLSQSATHDTLQGSLPAPHQISSGHNLPQIISGSVHSQPCMTCRQLSQSATHNTETALEISHTKYLAERTICHTKYSCRANNQPQMIPRHCSQSAWHNTQGVYNQPHMILRLCSQSATRYVECFTISHMIFGQRSQLATHDTQVDSQ